MEDKYKSLWNYLCGDGDIRHLYDYYDMEESEEEMKKDLVNYENIDYFWVINEME